MAELVKYLNGGDRPERVRELIWALLSANEFALNH
jgi:hypothetical protein